MKAGRLTGRGWAALCVIAAICTGWSMPFDRLRPVRTLQAQQSGKPKPVSFAILEDYDKGDDLDSVARDFALFEELEITTWRGSFGWDDYEPSRGKLDVEWLHRFADLAARHRIKLRPYLGYTPEWAARPAGKDGDVWNNPPARVADWARFASRLAAALAKHSNVLSYEIYNEENVAQWWDGSPREYASVLVRGARSIRQRDADAAIVFGGLVFPDVDWIEAVCAVEAAPRSFSVLPIHAYPETWTPPDVTVENYFGGLSGFLDVADAECGPKSIWINETGFATVPGRTEREQAYWWVRAAATFLALPRVEHIGVYEIRDLRPDRPAIGDAPNYHLGLTRVDGTRKLAFHTVDLLTDLLDVGSLAVDDGLVTASVRDGNAGELHHHLFRRPDGRSVLFVWDRTGSPTVSVRVPGARAAIEYEVDGTPHERVSAGQALAALRLSAGVPRVFLLLP